MTFRKRGSMTSHRRAPVLMVLVMAVAVAGGLLTGCTAAGANTSPTLTPVPAPTGEPYSVQLSGIAVTLLRPAALSPKPTETSANSVSFQAAANDTDFVRLLVVSTVCSGGGETPSAAPTDYVAYLHSLTALGATIKGEDSISIDGMSGTELTLGATKNLPGSLGQSKGAGCTDKASYGVATNRTLRLAVFDVQGKVVLVWADADATGPTARFFNTFQKMLQTVQFR